MKTDTVVIQRCLDTGRDNETNLLTSSGFSFTSQPIFKHNNCQLVKEDPQASVNFDVPFLLQGHRKTRVHFYRKLLEGDSNSKKRPCHCNGLPSQTPVLILHKINRRIRFANNSIAIDHFHPDEEVLWNHGCFLELESVIHEERVLQSNTLRIGNHDGHLSMTRLLFSNTADQQIWSY